MDNSAIDKSIHRIDCILESCESPELRKHYADERTDLVKNKISNCDEMITKVLNQQASGLITESAAEEMLDTIEIERDRLCCEVYAWYEDATNAVGYKLALTELAALSSAMVSMIPAGAIGKLVTAPIRKFILSRLSKYTLLHMDCVNFKDLDVQKYDLVEAEKKGIKFQPAPKWLDRGISRVHVNVYSYKGKEVIAIAYSNDMSAGIASNSALVEPMIIDGQFKKHQDYYVACMCTKQQFTHPAIKRVLKTMKKEWSTKVDSMKADIQESVEESISNGTHHERLAIILESVKDGYLDAKAAKLYTDAMRVSEIGDHF